VAGLVWPGRVNSLAITLLKLTSPGVPDIYQGTELWDNSLVDPDNRRPVDFELRRQLLGELDGLAVEEVLARSAEGLPKLWSVSRALDVRRRLPAAFGAGGSYEPLEISGSHADRAVGFMRGGRVVTVVPRLSLPLEGEWRDTQVNLPAGRWQNTLTGQELAHRGGGLALPELLARFPTALLVREDAA